jgi:hypothetical protein
VTSKQMFQHICFFDCAPGTVDWPNTENNSMVHRMCRPAVCRVPQQSVCLSPSNGAAGAAAAVCLLRRS